MSAQGPGPGHATPPGSAKDNYTFEKTELLPGNIGYIKFNGFLEGDDANKAAAAALAKVADCDALIFDLRDNGGGSPEMIKFISSYLFDVPTHLNSFYDRTANKTSETWTTAEVPGKRFAPTLPVYILTSGHTFSAAEEFTYNLKNLKRRHHRRRNHRRRRPPRPAPLRRRPLHRHGPLRPRGEPDHQDKLGRRRHQTRHRVRRNQSPRRRLRRRPRPHRRRAVGARHRRARERATAHPCVIAPIQSRDIHVALPERRACDHQSRPRPCPAFPTRL